MKCDTTTHQIFKYAGQQEDQNKRQLDARSPIVQALQHTMQWAVDMTSHDCKMLCQVTAAADQRADECQGVS
jgi:hypothetical protein